MQLYLLHAVAAAIEREGYPAAAAAAAVQKEKQQQLYAGLSASRFLSLLLLFCLAAVYKLYIYLDAHQ